MKTIIYVDGENLLHRVEEVLAERNLITHKTEITHFNLKALLSQLLPESKRSEMRYYGTKLRLAGISDASMRAKAERMIDSQRRLKRDLDRQGIAFIACGNLRIRSGVACRKCGHQEEIFQEKGVDVRLAVDLVREAGAEVRQVIVSSDSDLLPALDAVATVGGHVTYIAYEAAVNHALVAKTKALRTYTSEQVLNGFIKGSKYAN